MNREFHRRIALFAVRRLAPQSENRGPSVAHTGGRIAVEDGPCGLPHHRYAYAHVRHARFHIPLLAGSPPGLADRPELVVNGADERAGRLRPGRGNRLHFHNTCSRVLNRGYPALGASGRNRIRTEKGGTRVAQDASRPSFIPPCRRRRRSTSRIGRTPIDISSSRNWRAAPFPHEDVHGQRIRLYGIDGPERKQFCERDGKQFRYDKIDVLILSI